MPPPVGPLREKSQEIPRESGECPERVPIWTSKCEVSQLWGSPDQMEDPPNVTSSAWMGAGSGGGERLHPRQNKRVKILLIHCKGVAGRTARRD